MREVWQQIRERFRPDEWNMPAEWRAERPDSPAGEIIEDLELPPDGASGRKFLLVGTVGTGKSTELWRIAEARAKKGDEFVVFVDLVHHFNNAVGDIEALYRIKSWEVCFLCGVALLRAGQEFGHTWDRQKVQALSDAWSALARATLPAGAAPPSIDLFAAARSMALFASAAAPLVAPAAFATAGAGAVVAGGLKALAELAGAGKWGIPIGKKDTRNIDDQDDLMQTLVDKVNLLLGDFRQFSRPVLLVIDGLDRITDAEAAKALFLHSQMISRLQCPLVVCAPFALRNHLAMAEVRRFEPVFLHNAPVLDHENPARHGPGVAFMADIFRHRVKGLGAEGLVPGPLLDKLAYYSGGRSRNFVRMIHMLGDRGWTKDAPAATEAMVDGVIDEARRLIESGLRKEHVALLKAIALDPAHELPAGANAEDLLSFARLLPYPNESEWFYPHPLLLISKVKV